MSERYLHGLGFMHKMLHEKPLRPGDKTALIVTACLCITLIAVMALISGARGWALLGWSAVGVTIAIVMTLGLLSVPRIQRRVWGGE